MAKAEPKKVILQDVELIYTNFSGHAKQFNEEGRRNFNIILNEEQAETLARDGWNVRCRPPRDENEKEICTLKINLSFKGKFPPQVIMVTSTNKIPMTEDTVFMLDTARIVKADVIFNSYSYSEHDPSKISAYVETLYVIIEENELDRKYSIYEDSNFLTGEDDGDDS